MHSLSRTSQQTLPIGRQEFQALQQRLRKPWDHETVEAPGGNHLFVRVPQDEPDAVGDLERAVEALPPWSADGLAAVYLVGRRRTVHVPGYTAAPLIRERLRADAAQADDLRRRLREGCQALAYRSEGDPLGLLRLGVRVPVAHVEDIDEAEVEAVAHAAGPLLEDGRADRVEAVLLVADADHLRIDPSDFFEDVAERFQGARRRPERQEPRAAPAARPEPVPDVAEGGFPGRPHRVRPVGAPRRRVEEVEPVIELEDEVDAADPTQDDSPSRPTAASGLLAHVDKKRLELGGQLAVRMLRMGGFRVLTDVYRGRTQYVAAAERDEGAPRRVAVRTLPTIDRRSFDQMRVEARGLGADLVLAIVPDPPASLVRRAEGTCVRLVRPEDVPDLAF